MNQKFNNLLWTSFESSSMNNIDPWKYSKSFLEHTGLSLRPNTIRLDSHSDRNNTTTRLQTQLHNCMSLRLDLYLLLRTSCYTGIHRSQRNHLGMYWKIIVVTFISIRCFVTAAIQILLTLKYILWSVYNNNF